MSETARGRALIINNNVFPKRPELFREGSAVDVSNIRAVLAHLNFEVDVRRERTAKVPKHVMQYFVILVNIRHFILFLYTIFNFTICSQEMLKDIQDETENPDNEDYGMHVTVLMSHGGTFGAHGVLYGSDVKPVKLLDVFDLLSSDNFKHMAGKPKVVIVVACRSGELYIQYLSTTHIW